MNDFLCLRFPIEIIKHHQVFFIRTPQQRDRFCRWSGASAPWVPVPWWRLAATTAACGSGTRRPDSWWPNGRWHSLLDESGEAKGDFVTWSWYFKKYELFTFLRVLHGSKNVIASQIRRLTKIEMVGFRRIPEIQHPRLPFQGKGA